MSVRPYGSIADMNACENSFGWVSGPVSSCRGPQAALKFSYRSDRVTRY